MVTTKTRKQRTIQKPATYSGIGIHTGVEVKMRFVPAAEGTGIVFKRTDVPGQPIIPAAVEYVCDTSRSTTLGMEKVRIHTVEHVLAAVNAYQIDNLCIEVSNIEPPVGNGSSDVFVGMLERAGIIDQEAQIPIVKIQSPVYWSEGDIHIVALPCDGYRISYTLNYPKTKVLESQFYSTFIDSETFKREIAPCRTFALYEEVSYLMDRGLINGGSLDNAVIIKGDAVFSKGGLFFPNEMARHKVLDVIGDLSLVGMPFEAHIIAIRSGHASNYGFAQKIYRFITEIS